MTKHQKEFNPQDQASKPPATDEVAEQKRKAEEHEVAGRHKNDGKNDHQGTRRQSGSDR